MAILPTKLSSGGIQDFKNKINQGFSTHLISQVPFNDPGGGADGSHGKGAADLLVPGHLHTCLCRR